jgi:hypothetical protein
MKCRFFLLITAAALTILNLPCLASGDSIERKLLAHEPDAELTQMGVTVGTAYLHPWNDTRINLLLLLQDQGRLIKPAQHQPTFDDEFAPIALVITPMRRRRTSAIKVKYRLS